MLYRAAAWPPTRKPRLVRLTDLPTPAAILDRSRLDINVTRMAARAAALGVPLRPHGKTPKCVEVARLALAAGAIGLTVSTLWEAELYAAAGILDLFYAVALAPDKAARAAALIRQGTRLTCLVDHPDAVAGIAARARAGGAVIPLAIEIDVDGYRTGIRLDDPRFLPLAQSIAETAGVSLAGIMSYGGASYGETESGAAALAERHRTSLIEGQRRLHAAGLPCDMVSFGSSPAVLHAATMAGVSELRCGIYLFQDLFQAAIGACAIDDIALSVLTTVIGVRPDLNRIVIDAGGLALSKDLSTARTAQDAGYGLVCGSDGRLLPDLFVQTTSQELGLVTSRSGAPLPFDRLAIGTKLRVLPNHADMTAAAYELYHLVDGSEEEIVGTWARQNGW